MDVSVIRASVDSVELISRYVELKRAGSEWEGLCPFHSERSPSFKVNPTKGFCHCFGCGAHHDVIGFLMRIENLPFRDACRQLSGAKPGSNTARVKPKRASLPPERWIPVYPVPDYAPLIAAGIRCPVWNGKRGHVWKILATRADPYRDAAGRLMGYVLRVEFEDGVKITPCVTWCIGRDGTARWCVRPFQSPRPLCGLDELAARPDAPVLVVEGEKCKAIAAAALPQYVVVTWPGGSKGVRHADFSPLEGRDIVLWPDADQAGHDAMLGYVNYSGSLIDGIAQLAFRAGARSLRMIDSTDQRKGWDIADALQVDGWTARQLAAWAAHRVKDVEVRRQ